MIEQIDKAITEQLENVRLIGTELQFEEVCQFQVKKEIDEIPWCDLEHQGLYLIEVKNDKRHSKFEEWLTEFQSKWEDPKYLKSFTPNFKKKRINSHSELKDWIPLYLGISRNVRTRLQGHIFKGLDKPTFAMKLLARENLKDQTFRLSKIRLDVKNYDTILPKIESQLRERINPLIGKQ